MLDNFKAKIICGRMMQSGQIAYMATNQGLVRWNYLMTPTDCDRDSYNRAEHNDLLEIKSKALECVMNDEIAVFYASDTCDMVVIDLQTFTKTY